MKRQDRMKTLRLRQILNIRLSLTRLSAILSITVISPALLNAQESPGLSPRLDEVIVSSTPLDRTLFESAQPITVLSGTELMTKAQGTLGQTLASEPGISSSNFGPGASRPIIRGLGGDRVRILQNGIGTGDVSNTSPDHLVTIEPILLDKIEVIRGPAALLYGTSAVGGVVNTFDNRIPEELPEGPLSGVVEARGGTNDEERAGVFILEAPVGPFALHIDGSKRRTDDIRIPGFARTTELRDSDPIDPEAKGKLPSSSTDTDNITFGTSAIGETGFLGVAYNEFNSDYGVPNGEPDISIDAHAERVDLHGKLNQPLEYLKALETKMAYNEYRHTEFEGADAGTKFKNRSYEGRFELTHETIASFDGLLGFQYQHADFSALGEEAFQPPTETKIGSVFLFEETPLTESIKFQVGGRIDLQDTDATGYTPPGGDLSEDISRDFNTFSQSGGLVWSPLEQYAVALSLSHTERAPTGQELFSNGPHVATDAFEIGDPDLGTEKSLGIDLTLRKQEGRITGSVGGFYNRFSNFIATIPTGEVEDDLPVYQFEAIPADFYGIESEVAYHLIQNEGEELSIDYQPDWVWASDRDTDEALPFIPPLRMKFGVNYAREELFDARLEVMQVFSQDRVAENETDTDGYTMLNATVSRTFVVEQYQFEVFLRGTNLLNEKAREATSFIKDIAPLPGVNVQSGVRLRF